MIAAPASGPRSRRRWPVGAVITGVAIMTVSLLVVLGGSGAPLGALPPMALERLRPIAVAPPAPPPSPVPARSAVAEVSGPIPYYASPGGPVAGNLPSGGFWLRTNYLAVIDQAPGWLEVRLPQRPNGLTGWIPADVAQISTTTYGILINITTKRVQLYESGKVVADLPAGVGTPNDPTPTGQFYVMTIAASPGPGWGPFLIDTNAHSEAITSWEGSGDAFTALHGPLGADAAIGTTGAAISHGCVRLHDADLAQLAPVPPGAPVVIVA